MEGAEKIGAKGTKKRVKVPLLGHSPAHGKLLYTCLRALPRYDASDRIPGIRYSNLAVARSISPSRLVVRFLWVVHLQLLSRSHHHPTSPRSLPPPMKYYPPPHPVSGVDGYTLWERKEVQLVRFIDRTSVAPPIAGSLLFSGQV
jgi:hypothetical protein